MASALETTDHKKIRQWVEQRGGHPAQVKGTNGLLRIDFDTPEESLEQISWEDFFKIFDDSKLKFLYDPEPDSKFNTFVRNDGR